MHSLHGSSDCLPGEVYFAAQDVCCPGSQLPYADAGGGWTCIAPELSETRASCAADGMGFDPSTGACVVQGPTGPVLVRGAPTSSASGVSASGATPWIVGAMVGVGILWWMRRGRGR